MTPRSFALTFFMLASEDPVISQLAMESQRARSLFRISSFFSLIVSGTDEPNNTENVGGTENTEDVGGSGNGTNNKGGVLPFVIGGVAVVGAVAFVVWKKKQKAKRLAELEDEDEDI